MSASEYEKMRRAICSADHRAMRAIVKNPRYDANETGGPDHRTGLHTAVQCNDTEAIAILMTMKTIDCNKMTSDGTTPLMLASLEVQIEAMEKLLNEPRVDVQARNHKDKTAENLFPKGIATQVEKAKSRILFEVAAQRAKGATPRERNVAILVAICNYEEISGMARLPGTKEDQEEMRKFLKPYYTVYCINDAKDILAEVEDVMKTLPEGSVDNLQFLFSGDFRIIQTIYFF